MTVISMRNMQVGQKGSIASIKGGGELGVRLREMGLVTGVVIEIVGHAPLKDPVHIKLYGNHLTLRNNEADHIMVGLPEGGE